ncbi:4178_t:CDS:1, partial [Dentiscutata heterogama]
YDNKKTSNFNTLTINILYKTLSTAVENQPRADHTLNDIQNGQLDIIRDTLALEKYQT